MTQFRALPVSNELMSPDQARSLLANARLRARHAAEGLQKDLAPLKKLRDVTQKHPVVMTLAMFGAGYLLAHLLFSRPSDDE